MEDFSFSLNFFKSIYSSIGWKYHNLIKNVKINNVIYFFLEKKKSLVFEIFQFKTKSFIYLHVIDYSYILALFEAANLRERPEHRDVQRRSDCCFSEGFTPTFLRSESVPILQRDTQWRETLINQNFNDNKASCYEPTGRKMTVTACLPSYFQSPCIARCVDGGRWAHSAVNRTQPHNILATLWRQWMKISTALYGQFSFIGKYLRNDCIYQKAKWIKI